jgi:mono/diheme cytochrome c family protein
VKFSITKIKLAVTTLTAAAVIAGLLFSTQPQAISAVANDGEMIYKTKCAVCHAADGSGATAQGKALKVRDLRSAEVQKITDAQMTQIISKGKNKMPAYGKNHSGEQIKQLIARIRAMAKKG